MRKICVLITCLAFAVCVNVSNVSSQEPVIGSVHCPDLCPMPPSPHPTVQDWFDDNNYDINASTDETGMETFPGGCTYRVTILALYTSMCSPLGWYVDGSLNQLLSGSIPDCVGSSADFAPESTFGLYLTPSYYPEYNWYTEESRNEDDFDHAWVYNDPKKPGGYIVCWEDMEGGGDIDYNDVIVSLAPHAIQVTIDIKPGSDPNCFNNDGSGVIPVAILGSADFDVTEIDASTVRLESMAVKAVGKRNKLLAHIEDVNEDGFDDLVVQIKDSAGVFSPGDTTAIVTGNLSDGTLFGGTDTICIVGNPSLAPRSNARPKLTTTWGSIKYKY